MSNKRIAVLAVLSLWAAGAVPTSQAADPVTDAVVAEAAYKTKCASCHAKTGKGNPAMAKPLKVDAAALDLVDEATLAKTDADLIKITTDGKAKMPAYKGKLKDAEIAALVAYVRSLAPKQ